MSEQSEVTTPTVPSAVKRGGLFDSARQLACAWIGLWGVASDELGSFYQRCVARGEQLLNVPASATRPAVKPSAVKLPASEANLTQSKTTGLRPIRPMSVFNAFGAVESYHFDLNAEELLPTKQELAALNERIEALSREVDALAKQREED